MPLSKIKNMIIWALVIVNLFFLALVISNSIRSKRITEQMTRQTEDICAEAEVTLSARLSGYNVKFPKLAVSDPHSGRLAVARAFLGECTQDDGINSSYLSEKGSASISANGKINFNLNEEISGVPSIPGIELRHDYGDQYVQTASELPIFNCTVVPDEMRVSGTLAIGVTELGGTEDTVSAYTAILRFVSMCKGGDYFCTEILHIDPGYILTTSVTGSSELDPVWRISTDTGSVYIDGVGGGVLR